MATEDAIYFPHTGYKVHSSQQDKRNGLIPINQLEPDKMRGNNIRAKFHRV